MAKRPVPRYDFKAFGEAIKTARKGRKESRKMRFFIVVLVGALSGFAAAGVLADLLIGTVFKRFGIGEFEAGFSMLGNVVPLVVIPVLFALAAWIYSARLKRVSIVELIAEDGE